MKLLVDIPDDVYEHVKSTKTIETADYDIVSLYRATKNGTPVSTDGDLISREALKEKAETITLWNGDIRRFVSYETIDNIPTLSPEKALMNKLKEGAENDTRRI